MTSIPIFEGPRRMRTEDIPGLRQIDRACFGAIADFGQSADTGAGVQPQPGEAQDETYLIACEGQPVSQITIFHTPLHLFDAVTDAGSIGGVSTLPEFQGKGLATRLLDFCAHRLADDGARLMIISGERGLYQRTGNVPMGRYARFTLTPGLLPSRARLACAERQITLRKPTSADAATCARLYQAEMAHFQRPLSRFSTHFQAQKGPFFADEWVINMAGKPAAYLLLNEPWEAMGRKAGIREISEYAGSRAALSAALAEIMASHSIQQLHLPIPWQDTDFIQALRDFGLNPQPSSLRDHTWRLLNFPGLMRDLQPVTAARLEADLLERLAFEQSGPLLANIANEPDRCAITCDGDRLDLSVAEMTGLVLGEANRLPNDFLAPGRLAEILPALFPLPAFLPGLDYH